MSATGCGTCSTPAARRLEGDAPQALNLDKGWFAIVSPTGSRNLRAKSPMDDIIGPLVNKDVVARVLPIRDKRADSFLMLDPVRDLDLDEG